jgi:hypothetical protein
MLQVLLQYVLTYHSKASKGGGVPDHLVAKNGENLVFERQPEWQQIPKLAWKI